MTRQWNEPAGQVIFGSLGVLEKFVGLLRNDIVFIAEKERSVGFLNESMSDVLNDLTSNQYTPGKDLLSQFVQRLAQNEYARKVMYFRTHQLADNAFRAVAEQVQRSRALLQQRELAYTRHIRDVQQRAKNPKIDPGPVAAFRNANKQALDAVISTVDQIYTERVRTITAFAHAQIEMHARAMEAWSDAITEIDAISFDEQDQEIERSFEEILSSIHHDPDDF
jgi:hypothetical protein